MRRPVGSFVRCPAPATSWRPQAGAGGRACSGRGAGRLHGGDTGRCHASWCLTAACASGSDRGGLTKLNSRLGSAASSRSQYLPSFLFLLSFLVRPTLLCWDGCGFSLCVWRFSRGSSASFQVPAAPSLRRSCCRCSRVCKKGSHLF